MDVYFHTAKISTWSLIRRNSSVHMTSVHCN